jgi:hypothetical protein
MRDIKPTFASKECNTFDIIENSVKIGYYYEHNNSPVTGEKFETPVYEIYYDNQSEDGEEPDFCSSIIIEDMDEAMDFIDNEVF